MEIVPTRVPCLHWKSSPNAPRTRPTLRWAELAASLAAHCSCDGAGGACRSCGAATVGRVGRFQTRLLKLMKRRHRSTRKRKRQRLATHRRRLIGPEKAN
jgi:hypothetical protein